jgi:hypothetical protein
VVHKESLLALSLVACASLGACGRVLDDNASPAVTSAGLDAGEDARSGLIVQARFSVAGTDDLEDAGVHEARYMSMSVGVRDKLGNAVNDATVTGGPVGRAVNIPRDPYAVSGYGTEVAMPYATTWELSVVRGVDSFTETFSGPSSFTVAIAAGPSSDEVNVSWSSSH